MYIALRLSFMMLLLCGLLYPLTITGLGQWWFPAQANGSLVYDPKTHALIGATGLGQAFSRPGYFHPRPSANGYDGSNSGGSNLGATSQKLIARVRTDTATYRQTYNVARVPLDAVTTSASGLDPHISLDNALAQASRVAQTRKIPLSEVHPLIEQNTSYEPFNPNPMVHVLKLNLSLDQHSPSFSQKGQAHGTL